MPKFANNANQTQTFWASIISHNTAYEYMVHYLNPGPDYESAYNTNTQMTYIDACEYGPAWASASDDGSKDLQFRYAWSLHINTSLPGQQIQSHSLPPYLFSHFCRVRCFAMTHQPLKYITGRDFENAVQLMALNLSHNMIERIALATFGNASKLEENDLSFNRIEFVDDYAFQLRHLQRLFLQNNKIMVVQWEHIKLVGLLEMLTFPGDGGGQSQDYWMGVYFRSIRQNYTLDVSNNPLSIGSNAIRVRTDTIYMRNIGVQILIILPEIMHLYAQHNRISMVKPEAIVMRPSNRFKRYQMKTLNLSENCLTSISEVKELTGLQEIDVSFNQLETLDGDIFREMSDLRRVSLGNNRLKEIDLSFVTSTVQLCVSGFFV